MALVLNSRQFALYHQHLVERFRPAVLSGVHSGAQRAIPYLVQRTRLAAPANPGGVGSGGAVNTGAFIRGWRVLRNDDGATITNQAAHAPHVEAGRRPGGKFPPRSALVPWIMRRLGNSADEANRLYYPIAKAISKRGLIGRRILSADEASREILRLVEAEVVAELNRAMKKL